jgi:type II secretory pathway pseudopilin PulG
MRIRKVRDTDRGMTLGELMIASSVLLVCLTALAGVLGGSVTSSRMARVRDEAANLANARIEYARSLAYDQVGLHYSNGAYGDPAGDIVTPEQVGGFTVTTECTWVRTSSGRAAYKKVVVHVAWQQPVPGEIAVTTMIYGKSEIVTSGDLVVRLRYRENSDPVVNATVGMVSFTGQARSVLSDSTGEAFFGQVAIGAATLSVVPPAGCVVDTSTIPAISIAADAVTTVIVFVQQPARATLHVTDTSGTPVSDATVTLHRSDGSALPAQATNASGDALFTSLFYGDYSASIAKEGYTSAVAPFSVTIESPQPVVDVSISQIILAGITARVSDANSTPIPGPTVTVRRTGESTPLQSGTAGTNGEISFAGFDVGSYDITVEKSGYVAQTTTRSCST